MTIAIWPVRAILLMGTSLLLAAAAESGTLEAGAAKVDITPSADAGLIMSGYADRKEGFKGVHDHIYARAIVLGDGSRLATLVAWELIGVPDPVWEELSQRIARETGIPSEYLLLCAVHDHSAPAPFGMYGNDSPKRSEEHTSELQSRGHLVCRLLLEKKKKKKKNTLRQYIK